MSATASRTYPDRPFVAVSAAIVRDDRFLLVRRARPPYVHTLPGGVVETGETLVEETSLVIEPAGLAGYREAITRDPEQRVLRHFLVMAFAAHWRGGEPVLNDELSEARWITPAALSGFETTEGLAGIVEAAFALLAQAR